MKSEKQKRTLRALLLGCILSMLPCAPALAGQADVIDVKVSLSAQARYRFDVTVIHADEGWDHYADRWEVVLPDGTVAATRTLMHPHVGEQPFTRSLSNVEIPAGIDTVALRARDSVHGLGGAVIQVTLPVSSPR